MIIDRHINLEKRVEIGICQGLPVLPILFLIYISRVFAEVKKNMPQITSFSFMNNLSFMASRNLIQEVVITLEKRMKLS